MWNKLICGACALAMVFGSVSSSALAYPAETVPDAMRSEVAPVSLHVIVSQMEINVESTPSGGGTQQGGLVGALIQGAMDSSRAKRGVSTADQVRIALDGLDVDAIARAETARAFASIKWIAASKATFAKDPTLWGKMAVLDAGNAPHQANVRYFYELSPDLTNLTVAATVEIVDKVNPKAKKPEKRFAPERLAFIKSLYVITALPIDPAGSIDVLKAWTDSDGALLKRVLTESFAKAAALSARMIQVTPAEDTAMFAKDLQKVNLGWHRGRIVEGKESLASAGAANALIRTSATVKPGGPGVLIWAGAGYFVHSRILESVQ